MAKSPGRTHRGFEMIIAEDDCGGYGERYAAWLRKHYPSLKVTFIPRQSGGSGLFDKNGDDTGEGNRYWEKFCNS
jgi:hypothetical protein